MDKVVIVTGAGRGIARRVALDFAAQGSRVAVVDLVAERAKNTTKEIESAGGTAPSLVCDVRSEAPVRDMVEQTVRTWGRVDVLVRGPRADVGLRAGDARAAPFLPGLPISPALYDELVAAITGLARLTLAQGEQPPHGGRWGVARLRAVRYDPVASEHPR